jgi:anhydro-N-acetylmuramic acid kinase
VKPTLFIGMISGTSRDGVDAALVSFNDGQAEVLEAICVPYPPALAKSLHHQILTGRRLEQDVMEELDEQLADQFSDSVQQLLDQAGVNAQEVTAIGSHGQTVWHEPDGLQPESIQLGDPRRITQQTGIVTVGDFRRADIEAGGQGAPLAPLLHRALFRPPTGTRVVLNLGGIANISVIDEKGNVSGFDTGPANCLLDAWIQFHRDKPFDQDGDWAAGGLVVPGLLGSMLADPYFQKPAPKSTGVEYFNLSWLERFDLNPDLDSRDVQATLAELSAVTVADPIRPHQPNDVLVCGGGVHNSNLLGRLRALLPGTLVRSTADLGLDPDSIEALLFAWLARERLAKRPLDTRSITGARMPVLLGTISKTS